MMTKREMMMSDKDMQGMMKTMKKKKKGKEKPKSKLDEVAMHAMGM